MQKTLILVRAMCTIKTKVKHRKSAKLPCRHNWKAMGSMGLDHGVHHGVGQAAGRGAVHVVHHRMVHVLGHGVCKSKSSH